MLGAPGDGGVGVPGARAHRAARSSPLLWRHDAGHLRPLRLRRNPQRLHLGPPAHR